MELFGAVHPLVLTIEGYQLTCGEEDPEELAFLQFQDQHLAGQIAGALQDLYHLEIDLEEPREDEGLSEEIGTLADLHALREIAASINNKTVDDYHEGRVPPGYLFNHLINHTGESGYYLPVDFPQSFFLGDLALGSAPALLRELDALESVLAAQFPDEVELALATPDDQARAPISGPVGVWHALRRLCRSSHALSFPIHLG